MDKLTIEQKAKRYDEILARANGANLPYYKEDIMTKVREFAEYLLPELKESEDEKIRKVLVGYFKGYKEVGTIGAETFNGIPTDNILAWLEKQGEQKPYGRRQECVDCQFNYAGECKGSCAMKRDEQKPSGKVEPKFKVGDWVVVVTSEGEKVVQINSIEYFESGEPRYITSTGKWFGNGTKAHLWTIQDAKDGDVLAADNYIILFKKLLPQNGGVSYCHYDYACSDPYFNFNEDNNWYFGKESKIHPATKEQHELLFQKMKEAGYELDAEKKLKG